MVSAQLIGMILHGKMSLIADEGSLQSLAREV